MLRAEADTLVHDLVKAAGDAHMSVRSHYRYDGLRAEVVADLCAPWDELLALTLATMGTDGVHASSRTPYGQRAIRALVKHGHMVLLEDEHGRVVARKADP